MSSTVLVEDYCAANVASDSAASSINSSLWQQQHDSPVDTQEQQQERDEQQPAAAAAAAEAADNNEDDEDRMALTENERNLAIMIKEAITDDPDLEPISDFMCAQLAIIDNDDIETALDRVRHLQHFREEYGILDTVEDGLRSWARYLELFPEAHLSFATDFHATGQSSSSSSSSSSSVMVFDNTKFDSSCLSGNLNEDNIRTWLVGSYYTLVIFGQDFEAIRSGVILIAECEGYDLWKKRGISFKNLKRVWSEIAGVYPMIVQKIKYYHASSTMNLVVSMLKPFLPEGVRSRVETDCSFPQRLDQIYLVPSVQQANVRFLQRVGETLENRYRNEKEFQL